MAQEISFSIIVRLSDNAVTACDEHQRFATALKAFVGAVGLENAQTHLTMREVRQPRQRGPRKPHSANVAREPSVADVRGIIQESAA